MFCKHFSKNMSQHAGHFHRLLTADALSALVSYPRVFLQVFVGLFTGKIDLLQFLCLLRYCAQRFAGITPIFLFVFGYWLD